MFRFAGKRLVVRFQKNLNSVVVSQRRLVSFNASSATTAFFHQKNNSVLPNRLVASDASAKFPEQRNLTPKDFELSEVDFTKIAKTTLDTITEQLEALGDDPEQKVPPDFDVSFNGEVLTLNLGMDMGTYVINTQTPNRQIWLSSPFSGPRRFDWAPEGGCWVYRHDGSELGHLLSHELSTVFQSDIIINPYMQNDTTK